MKSLRLPSTLLRLSQGTAIAVLCFFSLNAQAQFYTATHEFNSRTTCYVIVSFVVREECWSKPAQAWGGGNGQFTHDVRTFRWQEPAFFPPEHQPALEDFDENLCFTASGRQFCPGDVGWQDHEGYTDVGCNDITDLCPGDLGWTDSDGYNEDGFDIGGLDRGGLTEAQGGGYWGAAGTGGSPPAYIDPPYPTDPQNGNNRDGNNILRCPFAYPITAPTSLLPSSVQDGLSGCANECVYAPSITFYDFDFQQEVVQLIPTGYACTSEPAMPGIEIATYTPPPMGAEPADPLDNLNDCYINGAYMFCDNPLNHEDPPECYVYTAGWIGGSVSCQQAGIEPNPETCGVFNGVYHCLDPLNNCESYNGSIQCVDPIGNVIDQSSPDHLINGGNGDGDDSNDVFADAADVAANGQTTQARQVETINSRQLARDIRNQLIPEFQSVTSTVSSLGTQLSGIGASLDELSAGDQSDGDSGLGDLTGALGDVGTDPDLTFDGTVIEPISNLIGGVIPQSTGCQQFNYVLHPGMGIEITLDTCTIDPIQPLLEFFLYATTVISLFYIAIGSKEEVD